MTYNLIKKEDADFNKIDLKGITTPGYKDYIREFDRIDFGWKIKKWFQIDLEKMRSWYLDLENNHSDCKFIQGVHGYMRIYDPSDLTGKTGHKIMPDTFWFNLCWTPSNVKGALPPERSNTKPEFREENDLDDLCPRDCFTGYGLEICQEIQKRLRIKKVLVSGLSPGTHLIKHQDAPDKLRFHVSIFNNDDSYWIIDNEKVSLPDDGWVYIVNTSLPHEVINPGLSDRINLYGKVFTEDVIKLGL